jgi:hypothetical protein
MRIVVSLAILFFAGCGGGPDTTTVSGKVSFEGKPVGDAVINFQARGAKPLGGATNSDGTYSFDLPAGEYQVRIDAPAPLPPGWKEGDPEPPPAPRAVPEKYASYGTSGLTATVTDGGSQTVDFSLP